MNIRVRAGVCLAAAAVVAVAVMSVACGSGGGDEAPTPIPTKGSGGAVSSSPTGGGSGGSEASVIKVVMKDNTFEPNKFTIPAGKAVKIEVDNQGAAVHNMHIQSKATEGKDFSSEALVNPKTKNTFEVKFSKKGEVKFVCDYHLPAMSGSITVQ